tara:strand:+ start:442 stop:897 length:456 start_codon:yes stop_codon:yes gene_type:complete
MNTKSIIIGKENWLAAYRSKENQCHKKTWVTCDLADGNTIFLLHDNEFKDIKEHCLKHNTHIVKAGLRYRSNEISLEVEKEVEAYYIVKSVRGSMGGKTKYCIILGTLENGIVNKKAYMTPELIVAYEDEDEVEKCFEEALVYNDEWKKKT